MKTYNYEIDLMVPSQINKDIIFNEAQTKIDIFCNYMINSFADDIPEIPDVGSKYIITQGQHRGNICYCAHASKGWQLLKPKHGMVLFVYHESMFFLFEYDKWVPIENIPYKQSEYKGKNHQLDNEFESINDIFFISGEKSYLYLYLQSDCSMQVNFIKGRDAVTIIFKQNILKNYKILWPDNILWQEKNIHRLSADKNSIDIVKLYKMPGAQYYLGNILGQNFQF